MAWLFLLAYTASGVAGLIYQVCWTRLLTLYIGHTTAAASAVVAAFLGGLAVGAAVGGVYAARVSPRGALLAYGLLEMSVAVAALLLPYEIRALTPVLEWAYAIGAASITFTAVRLVVSLAVVFVPAAALGATFPMAIRWYASRRADRAGSAGLLYALNATGAAAGALAAGFVLIPVIGVSGTTWIGVAASIVAASCVAVIFVWSNRDAAAHAHQRVPARPVPVRSIEPTWLAGLVLGLSGFAALVHEIAWTRVLTMILGPTTYAFAATLAAVITGIALGSAGASMLVPRMRRPALWLSVTLACAAVSSIATSALVGGPIPRMVAEQIAAAPDLFTELLWRGGVLTATLILPTAALLGAAFPIALAMVDDPERAAARVFAGVYAVNTIGSVAGALASGFLLIPLLGLESTLRLVTLLLAVASVVVISQADIPPRGRSVGGTVSALALLVMFASPSWDRELLASGAYMYAPFVPKGVNLEAMLKAGTLVYYREGAAATVSVKRLTGTTTLAVDGKTDASNRGDMLTQKLVAHLPLLLHEQPREVAIVGLGSGVTLGAALTHPVTRVDVLEISPEVVEASHVFREENRHALADSRARLLVTDGRSHLQLTRQTYDVIISEPSNPWIAGVAALFTREFFAAVRDRLAPGGVVAQWANAYNISDADLRAIVATFQDVFPHGTAWLVGADDVVLVASDGPLDERLGNVERHWDRPGVGDDLRGVGAMEPFALWSLFVAGPGELARYAEHADILVDDTMRLEFSGPRELGSARAGENGARLRALLPEGGGPAVIRRAHAEAGAAHWRRRGDMMTKRDAFSTAYTDYQQALLRDAGDADALAGLTRTAVLTGRAAEALAWLHAAVRGGESAPLLAVARSTLLAATGDAEAAVTAVYGPAMATPADAAALEQLAALHAEAGEVARLRPVVDRMRRELPARPATHYYAAVVALLAGDADAALQLATAAVAASASYAAAYDLIGAAHAARGRPAAAREAFLTSLRFDAHDSTAYANLGVLELDAGNASAAADYFAEALWLDPDSALAREGLRRATGGS